MKLVIAALLVLLVAPVRAEEVDPYADPYAAADDLTPQTVVGYKNGKKVKVQVVVIGYEPMEVATGKAFLAMREAARADGIDLTVWSGFRSMEDQQRLYRAWKDGYGNKAAKPGRSNHQLGKALDIYLGEAGIYDWLVDHAKAYGFQRTVKGEPWHWEYVKKRRARRHH